MNNKLNFSLTKDELNIVMSALGKRPYEEVFQLINTLQAQFQKQIESSGNYKNESEKDL